MSFLSNRAIVASAFTGRDRYYHEMATLVVQAARRARQEVERAIDLGAGTGVSTRAFLTAFPGIGRLLAVDPDPDMLAMCELGVMGDSRVQAVVGRGEDLTAAVPEERHGEVDLIVGSEVFHLFSPPDKESDLPVVFRQAAEVLAEGGVLAFNLGPSGFAFDLPVASHWEGSAKPGQIETELSHPLYQLYHAMVLDEVRTAIPDFGRESLWPAPSGRRTHQELVEWLTQAGFTRVDIDEVLVPIGGERILEFMRFAMFLFFRWQPLSELPMERKLELARRGIGRLMRHDDFERLTGRTGYHPTAVVTAVRTGRG